MDAVTVDGNGPITWLPFGHTLPVPPGQTRTKRMLVPWYCVLPPDGPRPPLHTCSDEGGFGSIIRRHAPYLQNSADVMPLSDFDFTINWLATEKIDDTGLRHRVVKIHDGRHFHRMCPSS